MGEIVGGLNWASDGIPGSGTVWVRKAAMCR